MRQNRFFFFNFSQFFVLIYFFAFVCSPVRFLHDSLSSLACPPLLDFRRQPLVSAPLEPFLSLTSPSSSTATSSGASERKTRPVLPGSHRFCSSAADRQSLRDSAPCEFVRDTGVLHLPGLGRSISQYHGAFAEHRPGEHGRW